MYALPMPRRAGIAPGEIIYHALNRANGHSQLFDKPEDYAAFEPIMVAAMRRSPIRLLAYCLMPNHWHMVLWAEERRRDDRFSSLAHAHSQANAYTPTEEDQAALDVIRYVERSALRAHLVDKAQDWRWCSLWRRVHGDRESLLSDRPFDGPADWVEWVNAAQTEAEIEALRRCVNRGTPYGTETWKTQIAAALGLKSTL
jgi:putative transposase